MPTWVLNPTLVLIIGLWSGVDEFAGRMPVFGVLVMKVFQYAP